MEIRDYNRAAWDQQVARGNRWTVPVTAATIAAARRDEWSVVLTPSVPVPRAWFPPVRGADVLALASGGGQQGPVLAAAGARVTVYDNSPAQLAQDRAVAEREGLELTTLEGDMRDLSALGDASFDLVFHPCANSFVPEIDSVWTEAARVLRSGGVLLAGFVNPVLYLFDDAALQRGELVARHALPYSDETHLSPEELETLKSANEPLAFSHSLEEQLGGQLRAGLRLTDLFEDRAPEWPVSRYFPAFIATRAVKP